MMMMMMMMMLVLQLWQISYTKMRLIDNNYFHERNESMELAIFQSECIKHLEASKKQLLTGWFPECQRIFYVGNKRRLIPTMRDLVQLTLVLNEACHRYIAYQADIGGFRGETCEVSK